MSNLCCGLAPNDDPLSPSLLIAAAAAAAGGREPPESEAAAAQAAATNYLIRGMAVSQATHLVVGDVMRLGQKFRCGACGRAAHGLGGSGLPALCGCGDLRRCGA